MKQLKLLGLLLLCVLAAIVAAGRYLWATFTNPDRAWQIAKAYDRLGNAAFNDDKVQTISERAYYAQQDKKPWGCRLCRFLDYFEKDHCKNSIPPDRGEPPPGPDNRP